jgi:hypothetical protein
MRGRQKNIKNNDMHLCPKGDLVGNSEIKRYAAVFK